MTFLRVFLSRLSGIFHDDALERDLDSECRFHLDMEVSENLRKGMSPEEARSAALRSFGGVTRVKEAYRERRTLPFLRTLLQDLRFGFRMLRRSPAFSTLAILCLTLGIGATTSVLSWIEGILLRPFPAVAHQDRLVAIAGTSGNGAERTDIAWPDFLDFQNNCTLINAFIADRIMSTTLNIGDRAEAATGSVVSANYFEALGVHPILGRGFAPEENAGRNAHAVTVISYRLWKDRFNGDPAIVGKTQMLNGVLHTIVGVAPEGFYGTFVGYQFKFWVPASMQEVFDPGGYKLEDRSAQWIEGFARLKPGVTLAQAQAEISAVSKRLETLYPATNRGRGVKLYPLWQTPFNNAGTLFPTLRIAFVVVCFVLLIACANVGNLLLARSFSRRHEMTVRMALGAARLRLLKQLLTESLILAAFATTGGLAAAYLCRNMMVLFFPSRPGVTVNLPAEIDWRVLALSAGVCIISTMLLGLFPALQTSRIDLAAAMKSEASGVVGGTARSFGRSSLVLVQVALSFLLLVGTGLLLLSLRKMQNVSPGFSTSVVTTGINLASAGYDMKRAAILQDQLIDRVQSLSGVESAALARITPFSYRGYFSAPIATDGYHPAPDELPEAEYNQVGPNYLSTMGIPMVSGRDFTRSDDDNAAPVAVINEALADRYFRGGNPVGQRLRVNERWTQIIGVAKDSKYRTLLETPKPFFYLPLRQSPSINVNLNLRTKLGPSAMSQAIGREIRALDPNLALAETITMREQVDRMSWSQRAAVILLGIFGAIALALAAIGLYGTMSCAVSQRRRELAMRMALGANPSDLRRLVIKQGLALTAGGVALGSAAALGMTRLIADLLYQVSPRDPLVFGCAFVVMMLVTSGACLLPARRATKTDPVSGLREEFF